MKEPIFKYTPEEIIEYFKADYRLRQGYDDVVLKNEHLTAKTTIFEWRDICDLVETEELGKWLNYIFGIEISSNEWKTIIEPEEKQTLFDLALYLSNHTQKIVPQPIKLFGQTCEIAGIFRTLMKELEKRGFDTKNIKPSSQIKPLLLSSPIMEIVNLIKPKALPLLNFKAHFMYKFGLWLFGIGGLLTIILGVLGFNLAWYTALGGFIGYVLLFLGSRLEPLKFGFEGIETVRDLVLQIQKT